MTSATLRSVLTGPRGPAPSSEHRSAALACDAGAERTAEGREHFGSATTMRQLDPHVVGFDFGSTSSRRRVLRANLDPPRAWTTCTGFGFNFKPTKPALPKPCDTGTGSDRGCARRLTGSLDLKKATAIRSTSISPTSWSEGLLDQGRVVEGASKTLLLSGRVSLADDPDAPFGVVPKHPNDMRAQFAEALSNVDTVLETAGMTRDDIIHTRFFVTDSEGRA